MPSWLQWLLAGVPKVLNRLFRKPQPQSAAERLAEFQLEEAESKRKIEILSDQLELAWARYATENVAANNDYFPEPFVANLINVRVEEFRKVASHMGEDRIDRISVNGEYLYRVVSGLAKSRARARA
jgi:hypothetical protein